MNGSFLSKSEVSVIPFDFSEMVSSDVFGVTSKCKSIYVKNVGKIQEKLMRDFPLCRNPRRIEMGVREGRGDCYL